MRAFTRARALAPWLFIITLVGSACGDDAEPAVDAATDATTADAALDTTDAPPADAVIPAPPDCGDDLLVTRTGAHGDVAFRLDRCLAPICGGGCAVSASQLVVWTAGRVDAATTDQIDYTKTHHNWFDSLVATLPDRRLRWRVEVDFTGAGDELHYLAIEALDGSPILAETLMDEPRP